MKVSYSKLSIFKECPFKYKCLYIDNLWHLRKDKPYLSMRNSVHLALKHRYRIRPTKFTYYFLEDDKRVTTSRTEKQTDHGLRSIKGLVKKIDTTQEFLPTPNPFCSFCDFVEVCPAEEETNKRREFMA